MTPQMFEAALRKTLEDRRLSRGERRALGEVLEGANLNPQQTGAYRRLAFDLVREALRERLTPTDAVDWLEDVAKLFLPDTESQTAPRSEAFFSPGDECRQQIGSLFRHARRTVDVCVFTITDNQITEEIVAAHRRGVTIRILTDDDKSRDRGSDVLALERDGIAVRLDRTRHHMHHKFALFDKQMLLTGSYNWTVSAAKHNEENLIVTDDRGLYDEFEKAFEQLWTKLA